MENSFPRFPEKQRSPSLTAAQCDGGHCHVTGKHPLPRRNEMPRFWPIPTVWPFQRTGKSIRRPSVVRGTRKKVDPSRLPWLVASSIDIWRRYYDLSIGFDRPFHEPSLRPGLGERGWFKVNFKRIILPSFLERAILHGLIAVEARRDSNGLIVDVIRNGTK